MSTEVGRLHAIFDLDSRGFDRGLRGVEAKVAGVTAVMKSLGSVSVALQGPLGGVAGRLQGLSSLSSQLGKELGILGIGMGVVSAVGIGLGIAMFKLAKFAADAGDEIFDLTQKVNFSAESISALKNAGETAGVEFGTLSSALGIFNKNIEAVHQGNEKLSRVFQALKIDISDNETALRSAFKALLNVRDGGQQGALAMQIFGRSGKEVLGIIKATNGDLDAAIKRYKELGTLIGTDAAEAANKFSDQLKELEQKLAGVGREVGQRFMPTVVNALDKINAALDSNRGHAKSWADDLVAVFSFAATQIGHILKGLATVIEGFRKTFGEGSIVGDAIKGETERKFLSLPDGRVMDLSTRQVFDPKNPADRRRILGLPSPLDTYDVTNEQNVTLGRPTGGSASKSGPRLDIPVSGGGGRGGGGGASAVQTAQQIAELQLTAVVNGLRAEQEANRRALDLRRRDFNEYATQYMVIEERRHKAVIDGLDAEQKAAEKLKSGREVALLEIQNRRTEENVTHEQNRNQVLDERGKIVDRINDFLRDQEREISGLTTATDQWDRAYQQLVDTLKEEGVELEENTRIRIESNNALAKERELVLSVTRARQVLQSVRDRFETKVGRERPPWIDLGGGSTVGGEPGTTTRDRVVTAGEVSMREQISRIRDQMKGLGFELTDIFDRSIGDGFERGILRGLETLGQGLLRIVQENFLNKLAKGLGDLLGNAATGGGFWGGLLKTLGFAAISGVGGAGLGGVFGGAGVPGTGAVGGGIAGAIGRDSGGPIWPNQLFKVHKDEYIMPTAPGFVIPKGGMGQTVVHNHYTIQLPPDSRGSYSTPKSKRQLSETLLAALQAAST